MPKKPAFARISITLPARVLATADKLAKRLDRSRSWVVAEAIRRFGGDPTAGDVAPATGVGETRTPPYGARGSGLGDSRLAQLQTDLKLTAEQRVRAAEDTQRTGELIGGSPNVQRLQFFDRYEDYLDWKRKEGILG